MITYDNYVIMANNPFFSGRIPQHLFDAIEAHRKETEESKTEVLTRALAKYINYELDEEKPSIPPIQEKLDEIFSRLSTLEKQLIITDNKREQVVQQPEIAFDNNKITNDNKVQILSAKETSALVGKGCSQSSLSIWKKQNELPKIKNGYQIEYVKRGEWKVTKLDNSDN